MIFGAAVIGVTSRYYDSLIKSNADKSYFFRALQSTGEEA